MTDEANSGGILVTAAKAVGAAAGKIASLTPGHHGAQHPAAQKPPTKTADGKFLRKNKARLPRKLKKLQAKQQAAQQ